MNHLTLIYCFIGICISGTLFAIYKFIRDLKRLNTLDVRCQQLRANVKVKAQLDAGIPVSLNRHTWAEFEGGVKNLKQVIVVADIVQAPDNSLLAAVIHNFGRGVHYSFIVSRRNAEKELHGFLEIFQALAKHAIKKHSLEKSVTDLVSIKALPDAEWDCVPLVFYRTEDLNTKTGIKTIAFWGDKKKAGIADTYEVLPPLVADALAKALMSGAPQLVKEMIDNLDQDIYPSGKLIVSETIRNFTMASRRN